MTKNLNDIAAEMYAINKAKGYFSDEGNFNLYQQLLLINSEVIEALQADRFGDYNNTSEQLKKAISLDFGKPEEYTESYSNCIKGSFEEEMADVLLRTLSLCAHMKIDIDFHVKAKMEYNKHTGRKKILK